MSGGYTVLKQLCNNVCFTPVGTALFTSETREFLLIFQTSVTMVTVNLVFVGLIFHLEAAITYQFDFINDFFLKGKIASTKGFIDFRKQTKLTLGFSRESKMAVN